jgi:20S proteasome alpha/beta subunit
MRTHRHRHPGPRLRRPHQREESHCSLSLTQDRFIDANTVTSIHNVTPKLGALTIGLARKSFPNAADCRNVLTRLQLEAAHFKTEMGHDVPVDYLASRLADYNQTTTQKAMQRVFGV